MKSRNIERMLVTGGCGFIGSNFVRALVQSGWGGTVVNLDLLTYAGNRANLAEIEGSPRYTFVHGDIGDTELLTRLFAEHDFDGVVHFAAESHVDRSIDDPTPFLTTNVLGTAALLNAARRQWAPDATDRMFLHVSTDEVYGSLGPTGRFTEETPIAPNSPYSASKASSDLLVRAYHETYRVPAVVARCVNNYGPYQFPEKLIPLMVTNAVSGKELPVYGDGANVRDWIHVGDHCAALLCLLLEGHAGEVYNIGSEAERSNIELVRSILTELGAAESLIRFVKDRPGHDRRYAIDPAKIRRETSWQPKVALDDGLRQTVRWYVENRAWWLPLLRT